MEKLISMIRTLGQKSENFYNYLFYITRKILPSAN